MTSGRAAPLLVAAAAVAIAAGCRDRGSIARLPEGPEAPSATASAAAPVSADPSAGADARTLTGTLEAHRRSTLTPRVAGAVARVLVRDGDVVKKDAPLVILDGQDFALRLRQAEAAVNVARVSHESARVDRGRAQTLLAEKAIPQAQYDAAESRFQAAAATLAQAQVAVDVARKAQADAIIRAPFDGVVTRRHVSEGEYAAVMPATALVTIEETGVVDLRVQVPATEMDKVREGDALHVRFPATGRTAEARVARVVASVDPRTRTFAVLAEIPNPDGALRPGTFAEVRVDGAGALRGPPGRP